MLSAVSSVTGMVAFDDAVEKAKVMAVSIFFKKVMGLRPVKTLKQTQVIEK
jgi:hypothetical protein